MVYENYLLGIDAGTSNIKAVVFNLKGEELFVEEKNNTIITKHRTWTEQNMNLLWEDFCFVVRNVLINNGINPKSILGVGITGQGEGCWLIDNQGNPVRDAILWSDGRAIDIVESIKTDEKMTCKIKGITGSHPFPGATSIILKWLSMHEKETLDKAYGCIFCKDWLRYKLTGNLCLETTDTSTSLLDLITGEISEEILDILGIGEYKFLFKPLSNSCKLVGRVTKEASDLTGLLEGTPVSAGLMDIVAAAVGMAAVEEGDSCTILGTTCCNSVVRKSCYVNGENTSGFECHAIQDLYLNVIASMAGTPNLDWAINTFFQSEKEEAKKIGKDIYKILEESIKDIAPGSGGIIYHPYISTGGERAPFFNPNARAQFFGISSNANKHHILKSIYEGVALSIKDCLQDVESKGRIYLGGGGGKSYYWAQIIADCTGKEVVIQSGKEYAAKGAALSAGVAMGVYSSISEAALSVLRIKKTFIPNEKNKVMYDKIYKLYRGLREVESHYWNLRSEIFHGN